MDDWTVFRVEEEQVPGEAPRLNDIPAEFILGGEGDEFRT